LHSLQVLPEETSLFLSSTSILDYLSERKDDRLDSS